MAYWWWMGSAVDRQNLTRELECYRDAGMGGVHIIPIYGAKGWEDKYIRYLSPQWMEMLFHTATEAKRLDLDVDMTTGTGWCFGGPEVTEKEADAVVNAQIIAVRSGEKISETFDCKAVQALVAFSSQGQRVELTDQIGSDGKLDWIAPAGSWQVYAISQHPSGRRVKRPAPGGEGPMLNPFYGPSMQHYLERFEKAFADYKGPMPRAMYHDSYEYTSNWAPDLFEQFEKRRGYRLQSELPALFGRETSDHAARVKCDFRETLSDLMIEDTMPKWVEWCHARGMLTRNQAHGSPGNLLDLYALSDIPETEMFNKDRSKLVSKFASSAAHVVGRHLISAETGTWLKEHFNGTLADLKHLADDLFISGVNHIIYHGTCYSPDEVPWPGWQFYASFEMNPRNSIWRDVPALNAYIARCQSVLQAGQSDNDVLLFWPIEDYWTNNGPLEQKLTVHERKWFEDQPIGKAAESLWNRGFTFDYISGRQIAGADANPDRIKVLGGQYRTVVVPECERIPVQTMAKLLALAKTGATIIFEKRLPQDVPGWGNLEHRRTELKNLADGVNLVESAGGKCRQASYGEGRILTGDLETALALAGVVRESMVDQAGVMFVRRSYEGGRHYFLVNGGDKVVDGWLPLAMDAKAVVVMDPMSGRTGLGAIRHVHPGQSEVWLSLQPGESLVLRALITPQENGPAWPLWKVSGAPVEISGTWNVRFLEGGPELPPSFQTTRLESWTRLGSEAAQRFAGTARYTLAFDAPPGAAARWELDLGDVRDSTRVRLNGRELGTLLGAPFRLAVAELRPTGNFLEVEVANVAANRIRDLDRGGVPWKIFHDINYVDIAYQPFDASSWPVRDAGLLGPVKLTRIMSFEPETER